MTQRRASCSCGSLAITLDGEPSKISICHCQSCQRRTGSAFGVAVFYPVDKTEWSGASTIYERVGDSGQPLAFHFCPTCGSTVFWFPAFRPGMVAIALGAFEDSQGLVPTQSVYENGKAAWLTLDLLRLDGLH